MKKYLVALAFLVISGGLIGMAHATSDSPTPYTVDIEGITLPNGQSFSDNGHVNIRTAQGNAGIHFEAKCITRTDAECSGKRHEDAQYIGENFIPWSAFGLGLPCVSWVQLSQYNEHYGEGGQLPVGPGCITSSPSPSPSPSVSPSVSPSPSPSPSPSLEPSPSPSPSLQPKPEPTESCEEKRAHWLLETPNPPTCEELKAEINESPRIPSNPVTQDYLPNTGGPSVEELFWLTLGFLGGFILAGGAFLFLSRPGEDD